MQEEKEKRELPGALKTLAGVAIVFLLLAAVYVFYQAMQVLFPPNTYETALLATVEERKLCGRGRYAWLPCGRWRARLGGHCGGGSL